MKPQDVKKLVRMLSKENIELIRERLIEAKKYIGRQTYGDLADDIKDTTHKKIGEDTVMRFIEEYRYINEAGDDGIKRNVRIEGNDGSAQSLEIYVLYLTHPKINLLSENFLKNSVISFSVLSNQLAKYLGDGMNFDYSGYPGYYQSKKIVQLPTKKILRRKSIGLSCKSKSQFMLFSEVNEKVDVREKEYSQDLGKIRIQGSACFTQKDKLLIIGKNVKTGLNLCYISIKSSARSDKILGRINEVYLLKQDNSENDTFDKKSSSDLFHDSGIENVYILQRVEDFSGEYDRLDAILRKDKSDDTTDAKTDTSTGKIGGTRRNTTLEFDELLNMLNNEGNIMSNENEKKLGRALLYAANELDTEQADKLIQKGADVNYVDPESGTTALHTAAAAGDEMTVDLLVATGKCDYTIKDGLGRRPSELAAMFTGNMKLTEKLVDLQLTREENRRDFTKSPKLTPEGPA